MQKSGGGGVYMRKKSLDYSPINRVPQLAGMILIFVYMRVSPLFARMNMSRGIVLV